MKKLLCLLTVCVISLPLRAAPPSEELCNDEIFITFCNENLELAHLFKKLDKAELNSNAEVKCLKQSLTEKALYLENTYSLFDNSSQSKLLLKEAIDKAFENNKINLKVQEDCLSLYIFFSGLCTVYLELEDYDRYFTCMATADAILLACLGIP